jgi:hypothetical protein
MRSKFIICKVMQKEAYYCAARTKNIIDIVLMPQGLHNEPDKLRSEVQRALEDTTDVQGRPYDAILLGYGLCSNGIVGLSAEVPMIVPRGHDCITLLLGSKDTYQQYFDSHKGVYWYSPGWIDSGTMPSKERYEKVLEEYRDKYGEENARYLMEQEQNWMTEYTRAVFVDWLLPGSEEYKQYTKQCAEFMHWDYDEIKGSPALMQKLLEGDWNQAEFLTIKPGSRIAEDLTGPGIIKAE